MKNKYIPVVFVIILLTTNNCNKGSLPDPYNTLPAITQEGKGTFGCLVNGKVWVPHYPCSLAPALGGCAEMHYSIYPVYSLRYSNGVLPIFFNVIPGRLDNNIETGFQLTQLYDTTCKYCIVGTGNYSNSLGIEFDKTDNSTANWNIYKVNAGNRLPNVNFEITKVDTVNKFVSGLFSFTLYITNSSNNPIDSVVVTDGRFDLPFAQEACTCSHN